jgi:hypothetical protein
MKLKLGPLPETETVKITVQLPGQLKHSLDQYARLHSQTWGRVVDSAAIIPYILEVFIERDRGFRSAQKRQKNEAAQ